MSHEAAIINIPLTTNMESIPKSSSIKVSHLSSSRQLEASQMEETNII
jgi:hypothetical protein